MKKLLFIIVGVLTMSMIGCSGSTDNTPVESTNEDNDNDVAEENVNSETEDEEVTDSEDEGTKDDGIKCSDVMPDPKEVFKNGTINIVTGSENLYTFIVSNYTDEEYDTYIEECKNMGFSDVSYELVGDEAKTFGAATEDGVFRCTISMEIDNGTVTVSCQKKN